MHLIMFVFSRETQNKNNGILDIVSLIKNEMYDMMLFFIINFSFDMML